MTTLKITSALIVTLFISTLCFASDKAKQQQEIRKNTKDILAQLYKAQPSAKALIKSAAGYAVFSNFGMKIFFAGGGSGKGIAYNQSTKKETFMKMVEVQAGLGLGVKKFRVIFVFEDQKKLNDFINSGWEAGAQATAAATEGGKGAAYQGAMSVSPGVWLYQLTDAGLAAEATIKGTKYYKDSDLN
ncbi:YSC84-related protein [Bdellovibrio sp. NC01]|uniref:lipid-binding SYLF domain-containing protein n=1 Tax=Bdellovibrio sp. NC01 TaxID=2220073 RepID=UPI0011575365|nr:YSC84-related protein [Bdellovibrio sp. NC01]QDK37217.1 hypothetical protein DOE51_06245 [Bdellovibrio sp. NC01]